MSDPPLPLWIGTAGVPAEEAEETFVLLHGYAGHSFSWRTWTPFLARRGHVVLVDMKGSGRAPRPDDDRWAPGDLAELVLRMLLERDLRRVTLVGHSLGGAVALITALGLADRGEASRLHRMVIVAGAAFRQRLPPFVALARRPRLTRALFRFMGPRFLVAQALRSMVYDRSDITGEQVRGYATPMEVPGTVEALMRTALQIVPDDTRELMERYPEIGVPALLLWGRHDPAVPLWVGERLVRALPHATLRVLERCGHLPVEERPEESLGALRAFLEAHP